MKKNITINLCGRLYQIDEDAYELLSQYTETLRNYFLKQEDGKEIADDIEERIAELLDELKAQGFEAITIKQVQEIIMQIGRVEEITSEEKEQADKENAEGSENQEKADNIKKPIEKKKFYCDSQNKMLAGVLAGCAQYFGGNVNLWRWGYVILSFLWWFFNGGGGLFALPFAAPIGNLFEIILIPFMLLCIPLFLLPVLPYVLVAIIAPSTKTAEDVLRMKGKEVNPQNLAEEVTEHTLKKNKNSKSFWDILVGIILIGPSLLLTIAFIVILCILVSFIAAPDVVAEEVMNIDYWESVKSDRFMVNIIICGLLLIANVGILLYCCLHDTISSLGTTPFMSKKQRLILLLLWVASIVGFVGCTVHATSEYAKHYEKVRTERQKKNEAYIKEHTHDGFVFNDEEWAFFQKEGWTLESAVHCERYTSAGEYMTGEDSVRYLDEYDAYNPIIYTASKKVLAEPGLYRLSATVRASNTGKFIYAMISDSIPEKKGKGITVNDEISLCEIPVCNNVGGNIWEEAKEGNGEPLVKEFVSKLPVRTRNKIRAANNGMGYGWSYICIDNIRVNKPIWLTYGVTTDESITGTPPTTGWFSATDFVLEKIGN